MVNTIMAEIIVLTDSEDEFCQSPAKKRKICNSYVISDDEDDFISSAPDKKQNATQQEIVNIDITSDETVVFTVKTNACKDPDNAEQNVNNEIEQVLDEDENDNNAGPSKENDATFIEDKENRETSNTNLDISKEGNTKAENVNEDIMEFIALCERNIQVSQVKEQFLTKVPILKKLALKLRDQVKSESFKEFLKKNSEDILEMPERTIESFVNVYKELDNMYTQNMFNTTTDGKQKKLVVKLRKCLKKLSKAIKELDEREVDFDEEENSAYIMNARYRERWATVYKKYCELRNIDPYAGQILHSRLDFANSKYTEFNRIINKKYKDNTKFPTFCEMNTLLRKCVAENSMNLSESEISVEVTSCFESVGNLMQKRRKIDLFWLHNSLRTASSSEDPATDDSELEKKLAAHKMVASKKTSELCKKYVALQETGQTSPLSEDSDDSHKSDSEEDS